MVILFKKEPKPRWNKSGSLVPPAQQWAEQEAGREARSWQIGGLGGGSGEGRGVSENLWFACFICSQAGTTLHPPHPWSDIHHHQALLPWSEGRIYG